MKDVYYSPNLKQLLNIQITLFNKLFNRDSLI